MLKLIHSLLLLTLAGLLSGQSDIRIGEWNSHLPYMTIAHVESGDGKVYYGTNESVLIVDQEDQSFQFLSKVEGLSDASIAEMLYDEVGDRLVLAYNNSVVDVVQGSDILSIRDIRDRSDIQGDKRINDLFIDDDEFLYMATGFGLVQFDLKTEEFGFTLDISERVNRISGDGTSIVITTNNGAYALDLSQTNTPAFFEEWRQLTEGLPIDLEPTDVYQIGSTIYLAEQDILYRSDGDDTFREVYQATNDIIFIHQAGEGYIVGDLISTDFSPNSHITQFNANDEMLAADEAVHGGSQIVRGGRFAGWRRDRRSRSIGPLSGGDFGDWAKGRGEGEELAGKACKYRSLVQRRGCTTGQTQLNAASSGIPRFAILGVSAGASTVFFLLSFVV